MNTDARLTSFARDIKPLFAKYIVDMNRVNLSLPTSPVPGMPTGTAPLKLGDYESVKLFYFQIQVSIHGYDFAPDGTTSRVKDPSKWLRKPGGGANDYITFAPHAMPPEEAVPRLPSGRPVFSLPLPRLPQEAIDLFDQWVKDGMPA